MLTGEARKVIEGFTNDNYEEAWQLLKHTYDNQMMIIDTHLEKLFDFPNVNKEDKADSMRQLVWHIQKHTSALKSLHQPVQHWDTIILHMAKKRLDYIEQRDWNNHTKSSTPQDMPKLEEFIKFITERCHTLRRIQPNTVKPKHATTQERKSTKKIVMAVTPSNCRICNGDHQTYGCEVLMNLSVEDRMKKVYEKRLCSNCLNAGHLARDCKATTYKKCQKRHNTILHKEQSSKGDVGEANSTSSETQLVANCTQSSNTAKPIAESKQETQVILSTTRVYARDINGKQIICRALLDPGSQSNIITSALLQKLKVSPETKKVSVGGINRSHTESNKVTKIEIEAINDDFTQELECLVLSGITEPLPQRIIDSNKVIIPNDVRLADPDYNKPGKVDLLLGSGLYWNIVIGAPRNRIDGQPALQNTKLGWIIGGNLRSMERDSGNHNATCLTVTNKQLHQQLEQFWKIENFPEVKYHTVEEKICEKHFTETTCRQEDGRFTVRLPKREHIRLGGSRDQAQRRLEAMERKFQHNPELKEAYTAFMAEYEEKGHMTRISDTEVMQTKESFVIPHQAVIRPDSLTTKLRVVFDASAKTTSGASLNDKLLPGPNLQKDLFQILVRFRIYQYVITGDIAQMYRQIMVDKQDRMLQLVLWRSNPENVAHIYQLNTVTYGTASAPFHAMRCLQELAIQHKDEYPIAARAVMEDFYMDDVITGTTTYQGTTELQRQLFELLQRGQFLLRKWRSNEPRILQHLDRKADDLLTIDKESAKTLGLLWNSSQDELQYTVQPFKQRSITKRTVLSQISKVFDPLGLVGPILIKGKRFMQQLWAEELHWDEALPEKFLSAWSSYSNSISEINTLKIYRNVNPENREEKVDLFGFGDASEIAYGACVYIINTKGDNNISSHLLCSKARVAPLKTISGTPIRARSSFVIVSIMRSR